VSTTTIRLPDELKAKVARAAKRAKTTPHGYILDAIAEKAAHDENRADFHEDAGARFADIASTGKTIAWADMRRYLEARIAGGKPARPAARKMAR
jgi:predicted transcriptional regulator